jgi:N-acetylglucosaminyldiphosphoundecaprenol N-acetyl-beta-D-mannosaminyltransferase
MEYLMASTQDINKTSELELFGVRFHALTTHQLLKLITLRARQDDKTIVSYVNIHTLNLAYELKWYKDFLNQADLVYCDGFGVILGAILAARNIKLEHRQTCPDWIEALTAACEEKELSIFYLASDCHVLQASLEKLRQRFPRLKIAGHHGYFSKYGYENEQVIGRINQFKPDILGVGFGMPTQEAWIKANKGKIEANVFISIGGCLDYYSDSVFRGPKFLTDHGFEWLVRLIVNPRRLWRRYIIGNPLFFFRLLKETLAD